MTFKEWVDREVVRALAPTAVRDARVQEVIALRKQIRDAVAVTAGVSVRTTLNVYNGQRTNGTIAVRISEATGGKVPVYELVARAG